MPQLLSNLIIITSVSILMFVLSFIINNYKYEMFALLLRIGGVGILIGTLLFGWMLMGLIYTVETKNETVDIKFIKTEQSIIIDDYDNEKVYYFNKKIDFNNISDTTTIYYSTSYNIYKMEVCEYVYYKFDDKIYQGLIKTNN